MKPNTSQMGLRLQQGQSDHIKLNHNIDGLVQERRNSSVLAMELRLSCTNPSIWCNMEIHTKKNILMAYSKTVVTPLVMELPQSWIKSPIYI